MFSLSVFCRPSKTRRGRASPSGWVVVGGLLLGTFFSLIVVPVMYVVLARLRLKNEEKEDVELAPLIHIQELTDA